LPWRRWTPCTNFSWNLPTTQLYAPFAVQTQQPLVQTTCYCRVYITLFPRPSVLSLNALCWQVARFALAALDAVHNFHQPSTQDQTVFFSPLICTTGRRIPTAPVQIRGAGKGDLIPLSAGGEVCNGGVGRCAQLPQDGRHHGTPYIQPNTPFWRVEISKTWT
jgi:hypothetical protein